MSEKSKTPLTPKEEATARLSKIYQIYSKSKTGFDDPDNIEIGKGHLGPWFLADLRELYGISVMEWVCVTAGVDFASGGGDIRKVIEEIKIILLMDE